MRDIPVYEIEPAAFWKDPYPDLARMQAQAPMVYVPQLGAVLMTRRDDIFENEKRVEVFSSDQPEGLMTVLMGQNMMRKDGDAHMAERRATFPALSPRTVRNHWRGVFAQEVTAALDEIAPLRRACMVRDIAMRLSGEALCALTGLTNLDWREMDRVSQGMIDGCANYAGDAEITRLCNECTAIIDAAIDERMRDLAQAPDPSLLSVQMQAGLPDAAIRANVKLAISGGQNEPRDAIAGVVWALLTHPDQLARVQAGEVSWMQAFEEYARWISPIGMSPRRVAREDTLPGGTLEPEDRVFLMFGAGNRDPRVFEHPERFDISRDTGPSLAFGAGPHFCAGAATARCLIAEIAVPELFARLDSLRLEDEAEFGGWAFRGPLSMPVAWG